MDQKNKPLFVIDDDPVVDWPVIVKLPMAGGTFAEYQFTVLMRVLSPADYEKLFNEAPDLLKPVKVDDEDDKTPRFVRREMSEIVQGNVPSFQKVFTGWSGVKDSNGNTVAYTPEKLAEQITGPRGPALSAGLWRAIREVRYGTRLDDGTEKDGAALGN